MEEKTFQPTIPQFTVSDATEAIEWYCKVFGAKLTSKHNQGDKVLHAVLKLANGAEIFVNDDFPEMNNGQSNLPHPGHRAVVTHLNIPLSILESTWKMVVDNGATVLMELKKQFWGQTYGTFQDPFGHAWSMGEPHHEKPEENGEKVGQKRRLEGAEDDQPPSKRARMTPASVSYNHGDHWIKDYPAAQRGIFMEFQCGHEGSVAPTTFSDACKEGLMAVWTAINSAGFHEKIGPVLAFCPEEPSNDKAVPYAPGMVVKEGVDIAPIVASNDRFVVREIPGGKWFVYAHIGSYKNLGDSWHAAKEEASKHGRMVQELAHERYVNDPSLVSEDELITQIWLKID